METCKTLKDLKVGESATVATLLHRGAIRRRLCDIGLIEGTVVKKLGTSPCNDPSAYRVRGAVVAIRDCDAAQIAVLIPPAGSEATPWD